MPLARPPAEVPRISGLEGLAPKFREAVNDILREMREAGFKCKVFESLRTNERQEYLYGFGREYDDGRGPVTKAATADKGWHFYGLAVDIVEDDATPWTARQLFWQTLGLTAESHHCNWGGRWTIVDLPHIQWANCRQSPSPRARELFVAGGRTAVWKEVGAAGDG